MELQFIDNSATINPDSRKLIRSHVMKKKNMGRKIQARGHKGSVQAETIHDITRPFIEVIGDKTNLAAHPFAEVENALRLCFKRPAEETAIGSPLSSPLSFVTGSEYTYFTSPVQFTRSMRYMLCQFNVFIFDKLYPHEFCRPVKEIKSTWFKSVIMDQAYLHCILAVTTSFVSHFRGDKHETLEAAGHFSRALKLVNDDLSAVAIPQESTIGVIVMLTMQSNMSGALHTSRIHLDGLQRIIDLRPGGLGRLRECNLVLMQKLCRADNGLALLEGTPTHFGKFLETISATMLLPLYDGSEMPMLSYPLNKICLPLQLVTQDVLALCRCAGKMKLEAYEYQDAVLSICQRLLDFAPLSGVRPLDTLEDAWQLGLLSFMTTVLSHPLPLPPTSKPLLPRLLRARLETHNFLRADGYQPILLWFLFIYGVSSFKSSEECRLVQTIQSLSIELEINTWNDAKRYLELFPWIGIMQNSKGEELWGNCLLPAATNKKT